MLYQFSIPLRFLWFSSHPTKLLSHRNLSNENSISHPLYKRWEKHFSNKLNHFIPSNTKDFLFFSLNYSYLIQHIQIFQLEKNSHPLVGITFIFEESQIMCTYFSSVCLQWIYRLFTMTTCDWMHIVDSDWANVFFWFRKYYISV